MHSNVLTQIMMQWLAKLAIISGRVPVWPTVDCSASYAIGRNFSAPQGEPSLRGTEVPDDWLPYWSRSWKKVHCYFMPLLEPGARGFGMHEDGSNGQHTK
jgi:hypothetical protein